MNHGSLFSGIGGFDLAAEWMGWNNVFHCEINEFSQRVLKHHFPKSISYADIKTTDFSIHRGKIDIITGGFPCQPYSQAGKRRGKDDPRHLFPEMLRAIQEIQPSYVVGENVRGITNWNGGLVFDEVQADLEAEGYEVLPFLLPACGINAPHRRDRIWFIAHSDGAGKRNNTGGIGGTTEETRRNSEGNVSGEFSGDGIIANSESFRAGRLRNESKSEGTQDGNELFGVGSRLHIGWEGFPTVPPVCRGDDGFPFRLDGTTFPKWRSETIKAYGNAIVPGVALQIFKAIEATRTL